MNARIALYYRVSTQDQRLDPQRLELAQYCQRRGWNEASEYSDQISGAKFSRTGLYRLMSDVRKHKIDVVVCVKLDRLGRSLPHLAQLISEMDQHRVALICTSQGIDTSHDNPAGRLQMHVLMAVAEFERELIKERTRAGLEAAKSKGVKLGRPGLRLSEKAKQLIQDFRDGTSQFKGLRQLADAVGCSVGKIHALV